MQSWLDSPLLSRLLDIHHFVIPSQLEGMIRAQYIAGVLVYSIWAHAEMCGVGPSVGIDDADLDVQTLLNNHPPLWIDWAGEDSVEMFTLSGAQNLPTNVLTPQFVETLKEYIVRSYRCWEEHFIIRELSGDSLVTEAIEDSSICSTAEASCGRSWHNFLFEDQSAHLDKVSCPKCAKLIWGSPSPAQCRCRLVTFCSQVCRRSDFLHVRRCHFFVTAALFRRRQLSSSIQSLIRLFVPPGTSENIP